MWYLRVARGALLLAAAAYASHATDRIVANTNDSGTGSLRAAISAASTGDTVLFTMPFPATITLTSGTLTINTSLTIAGPGVTALTIDGGHVFSVFTTTKSVKIFGLVITHGAAGNGGAINASDFLEVDDVQFVRNLAENNGGAIFGGDMVVNRCDFEGNTSNTGNGGAIFGDSLAITGSSFVGDAAFMGDGGAIYSEGGLSNILNSTFDQNIAATQGGAIFNTGGSNLTIDFSTIANGAAATGGSGVANTGALAKLTLKNSILANNTNGGSSLNCYNSTGTIASHDFNLSDDMSCTSFLTAPNDFNGVAAGLDPAEAQLNGGSSPILKTIALLTGSLAIDSIVPGNCTQSDGTTTVTTDGRGISRPQLAQCDAGAYEYVQPPQISKQFGAGQIAEAGSTTLEIDIANSSNVALFPVQFTDPLPGGMVSSAPSMNNCAGTVSVGTTISLTGGSLLGGASCKIVLSVTAGTAGVFTNTTSTVTAGQTEPGNFATAGITVAGPPQISKAFLPAKIVPGGTSTLTFTIQNANSTVILTGVNFSDTLPAGVTVANPANSTNFCGGTLTASGGSIALANGSIGAGSSCNISVNVTGATEGLKNNTTGIVGSNEGGAGNMGTASLRVALSPSLGKTFSDAAIVLKHASTLTFRVANPNKVTILTGIDFSDTLPPGLLIATPNGLTDGCGGSSVTASAGTGSIVVTGITLAPAASCAILLKVTGTALGLQNNITGAISSDQTVNGASASAAIVVGDVFELSYAANLNIGDSAVNLTNSGAIGVNPTGNICADVYVFDPAQELIACCACPLPPNSLATLSVKNDFVAKMLTRGAPQSVTVALLASTSCNPSAVTVATLEPGIHVWGTTLHALVAPGAYATTETPYTASDLSSSELARLTSVCGFIQADGGGYGICNSCRAGAVGADRQ